ncbi:MAG: potassium transporter Kup [Alphaproteobacteria bacterium]
MQMSQTEAKTAAQDSGVDAQLRRLTIGAIGVVYGDIGTSPIYTLRETIKQVVPEGQLARREDVLGILSLILWSLLLIPTIKYITILLRVDNHGEGGTLALMAMARSVVFRNTTVFLLFGMMGAGLFYGDAILTPALSVLSALEGLEVITPAFTPYIMPITLAIIVALFVFQKRGTDKVSGLFGPVCAVWFIVLAVTGVWHIQDEPSILLSFNPIYAFEFFAHHGKLSFIALGCVFLAVTGAEALYADLGHFGKKPIRIAWLWFVLPCLALNYLGQGAMVLHEPSTLDNPFFKLVPHEWMVPLVFITTLATIIASQAVITGAFSLTKQAVNLGLLPRMEIRHTSASHSGQIYVPQVNYIIMMGVIVLVLMFKTSGNMAAAYGISITGTMVLTAIMAFFVIWQVWGWSLPMAAALMVPFFIIDCVFLGANMMKVFEGGWVTLAVAAVMVVIMVTWTKGSFILNSRARKRALPIENFIKEYRKIFPDVARVRGCAIFFAADPARTPASLQQNLRHNKVLHDKNIILSVKVEPIPYVENENRAVITHLSGEFSTVLLRFGFQETPAVARELMRLNKTPGSGIAFDWSDTSLFLSRRSLRSHPQYGLPLWQDMIYIWLSKHAAEPTDFYKLPVGRVIEIGKHMII